MDARSRRVNRGSEPARSRSRRHGRGSRDAIDRTPEVRRSTATARSHGRLGRCHVRLASPLLRVCPRIAGHDLVAPIQRNRVHHPDAGRRLGCVDRLAAVQHAIPARATPDAVARRAIRSKRLERDRYLRQTSVDRRRGWCPETSLAVVEVDLGHHGQELPGRRARTERRQDRGHHPPHDLPMNDQNAAHVARRPMQAAGLAGLRSSGTRSRGNLHLLARTERDAILLAGGSLGALGPCGVRRRASGRGSDHRSQYNRQPGHVVPTAPCPETFPKTAQ